VSSISLSAHPKNAASKKGAPNRRAQDLPPTVLMPAMITNDDFFEP
jgi:hypothetical protein